MQLKPRLQTRFSPSFSDPAYKCTSIRHSDFSVAFVVKSKINPQESTAVLTQKPVYINVTWPVPPQPTDSAVA